MKKELFKDKKITVMGLGVLGRGLQVTKFLAENGALLTVTDLKKEDDLKTSLVKLKKIEKIKYVFGSHKYEDFEKADFVVKAAGVPLDSPFIKHAKDNAIPIKMDASWFVEIVKQIYPSVRIVGITGTRGKSMTTALTYHILKQNEKILKCHVHLGGNMRMKSTLPILKKIKQNDIVVLELDSWQLQGFDDQKISPDISVFTNLMTDHMNYYNGDTNRYLKDKENIFKYQNSSDFFITNKKTLNILTSKPKSKVIIPKKNILKNVKLKIFGEHNLINATYGYEVAKIFNLSEKQIIKSLKSFGGLEGRLEYLGKISDKKISVINDNNSTTPEACIAGIKAVKEKSRKKIILVCGGSDKNIPLQNLAKEINRSCKMAFLIPGTGTEKLKKLIKINYFENSNFEKLIRYSFEKSNKNDLILFSPAFASFGLFKNEYDRNDSFLKIIRKISKNGN